MPRLYGFAYARCPLRNPSLRFALPSLYPLISSNDDVPYRLNMARYRIMILHRIKRFDR